MTNENAMNGKNSGATFQFNAAFYNYGTMSGDVVNHNYAGSQHEAQGVSQSRAQDVSESRAQDVSLPEAQAGSDVPDIFTTNESMALMQKLIEHRFIDEALQPIELSWAERSILVDELSARLHISDKWQAFGALWHLKPQSLRSAYNKAMEQKKTSLFFDRIREAIEA